MRGKLTSRNGLISCFAIASLLPCFATTRPVLRQDRSWKRYYNSQWGYCVSYPGRWRKGDAFDGAGMFVETGVKRDSRPVGEIDIGVLQGTTPAAGINTSIALIDDLNIHLDGLKKFERAQSMEVIEKREMTLLGNSALFTKDRYYDPLDRATWVEEIVFARRQDAVYRMELECRADQVSRFEPLFAQFISTFQFDCAGVQK